jgi:hypothetical protein
MKILTIGDIHGKTSWKILTHGGYTEYSLWRNSVDESGGIDTSEFWNLPCFTYDKIIFVGDYVDAYDCSNVTIKHNLLDIIHFKKTLGDKVVLLWGNHDVQYFVKNNICSGYRAEMQYDLQLIFTENLELFEMAYEIVNEEKSYLWTHAGVTSGWLKNLERDLWNPNYRFYDIVKEKNPQTIVEKLNFAWELRHVQIFAVDQDSGGSSLWGGPLWVRPRTLDKHPLVGVDQIVGHTYVKSVKTNVVENGEKHHYVDCLDSCVEALELTL